MKITYLLLVLNSLFFTTNGQIKIKFELQDIPTNKDVLSNYFLAGSFNNWNPNDTLYKFSKISEGKYVLNQNLPKGRNEFKITRGNWTKSEAKNNGSATANRILNLLTDTTVKLTVANWVDNFEQLKPKHTVSKNVQLLDSIFPLPQLNTNRRIWIYLPKSYATSTKKYPVLYMQDGQNLFDEFTSGYGEWKIDEQLDSLIANGARECIIIGIAHGGKDRIMEYNPYNSTYGEGKGKQYLDFLVKGLKPYIDKNYRTLSDLKNTTIAGSSMGGLISIYAITNYPEVFGNAGIFSPSFWIAPEIFGNLKANSTHLKKAKIFFVAGNLESRTMISDIRKAYHIINPNGINKNMIIVEKSDGDHKEWFWSREFVNFYKFITH